MKEPIASRPYMPGYGIMDADQGQGLLPWSWFADRVARAHTYWVSTTRPDGSPHVMPVWGVWLADTFCFSTGDKSRKARNIAENPRCVITCEVDDSQIMVEGIAEVTKDSVLSKRFAEAYSPKYEFDMEGFNEPIYAVRAGRVFGFISSSGQFTRTATRWTFDRT